MPEETKAQELMREAIAEAKLALAADEVPIGCVIYHTPTDRIIGRGHNRRENDHDPTAHAEIEAMRQAGHDAGPLAAARLHAGRHARALPDVRRRDRQRENPRS